MHYFYLVTHMSNEVIPKKTNGKRNRQVGHALERQMAERFRKIGFPHVVTCRSESRSRDNQKIDLINKDERINGRLPYNVQCKNSVKAIKYPLALSEMPSIPGIVNVVVHRQTVKINDRFISKGDYALLHLNDWMDMVQKLQQYEQGNVGGKLVSSSQGGDGERVFPKAKRNH